MRPSIFVRLIFSYVLLSLPGFCTAQAANNLPAIQSDGPHDHITIAAAGERGKFTGFNFTAGERVTIPVRFSSNSAITAGAATITKTGTSVTVLFSRLTAGEETGLVLDESHLEISLPDRRFPRISYDLRVKSFDTARWQRFIGNQPFHFLTLSLDGAEVWHQGGWLYPTPKADAFPLLGAAPPGSVRRTAYPYNRQWSLRLPLAEHTLPVVGLWSPAQSVYAGWQFEATGDQLSPGSAVCTAFCNGLMPALSQRRSRSVPDDLSATADRIRERDGKNGFVALVAYRGEHDDRQFDYPEREARFTGTMTLVCDTNLDAAHDPNCLLWENWWRNATGAARNVTDAARNTPPRVQALALREVAGQSTAAASPDRALGPDRLGEIANNLQPRELFPSDNKELGAQAKLLMKTAVRFRAMGQECLYWSKPAGAAGEIVHSGESAATLHHSDGWASGSVLLAHYRTTHNRADIAAIQGVLHWAERAVWQRYADDATPSEPGIGDGSREIGFLLDYYTTFVVEDERRADAQDALALASTCAYRYLICRPAFSPSSRNWTVQWAPQTVHRPAGVSELAKSYSQLALPGLIDSAVYSGDQILVWAANVSLQSLTSRGSAGRQESAGTTANVALPDETPCIDVVIGPKAALVLRNSSPRMAIKQVRCSGLGEFALSLRGGPADFAVTITFPFANIKARSFSILRGGLTRIPLRTGERVTYRSGSDSTVTITGLHDQDTIVTGGYDASRAQELACGSRSTGDSAQIKTGRPAHIP